MDRAGDDISSARHVSIGTCRFMSLKARTGIFFIIIGVASLTLFYASVDAGEPMSQLLIVGLPTTALGLFLWWRGRERPSVERFRLARRIINFLFSKETKE